MAVPTLPRTVVPQRRRPWARMFPLGPARLMTLLLIRGEACTQGPNGRLVAPTDPPARLFPVVEYGGRRVPARRWAL